MGSAPSTRYPKSAHMGNVKHGLADCVASYYGKRKPACPDGDDTGLQEIYTCWNFPVSTGNIIHVLPRWRNKVSFWEENWDPKNLETSYLPQLKSHGISEEAYQQILAPINQILSSYFPFQTHAEMIGKAPNGESGSFYLVEIRKRLRQATNDYSQTQWSLRVHKYANEGAGNLFTENIYHSIQIKLLGSVYLPTRQNSYKVRANDQYFEAPTGNDVTTYSPSQGLKLENVGSNEKVKEVVGKVDGEANAPSPRPNYGDAEARDM